MLRRIPLLLTLLTCVAFQVQAHTRLSAATPAESAVTHSSPEQLELEFNGAVRLLDVSLQTVAETAVEIGPLPEATQQHFSIPVLAVLDDGDYVIKWRAVGADTHPVSGEIRFSVATGESLASE